MAQTALDTDSIGPELDLADETIPPHVGARLGALSGRDDRVETWGDWIDAIRSASERARSEPPTEDDLCHLDDGDHSVEVGDESLSFVCVLDPLVVPFLRGTPGTVHSITPEDGESIIIDVEADGVTIDVPDAVVSLGVSRDVDVNGTPSHEDIYTHSCPYIHAFASVDEYERWTDRIDSATTSVPVETGVAITRELSTELFGR